MTPPQAYSDKSMEDNRTKQSPPFVKGVGGISSIPQKCRSYYLNRKVSPPHRAIVEKTMEDNHTKQSPPFVKGVGGISSIPQNRKSYYLNRKVSPPHRAIVEKTMEVNHTKHSPPLRKGGMGGFHPPKIEANPVTSSTSSKFRNCPMAPSIWSGGKM